MNNLVHLQTNYQPPAKEKEVDEYGVETVYTKPSYKTTDNKVFDSIDDAREHQKIVSFVNKEYYWLHGTTERGRGYEYVSPPQAQIQSLLIRMIEKYNNQ